MKPAPGVWKKSPPALVERFAELVPENPRVQRRQMFGYPAAFVNGHLFASLYQSKLVLRLSADDLMGLPPECGATTFEPMPGRPMRNFVALEGDALPATAELSRWIGRALALAAEQPAKESKKARAARPTTKTGPSRSAGRTP